MPTDADGNVYNTITIGTQTWFDENLKTTKLNDGTSIAYVTDVTEWINNLTGEYCWYNNEIANKNTYGALYTWNVVKTGKLCPAGWHVPSDVEWNALISYLGGINDAGGKLKESGTTHWTSPNTGATDEVSFKALPGGYRSTFGSFANIGIWTGWWSSTSYDASMSWMNGIANNAASSTMIIRQIQNGQSVRCIKN